MKRITCECRNIMIINGFWFDKEGNLIFSCYCTTCMRDVTTAYPMTDILGDIKEASGEEENGRPMPGQYL